MNAENMEVTYLNIEDVIPYEHNPRINDEAVNAVADSIQRFGFQNPIIVNREHVIISGHTRRRAAIRLNMDAVPVMVVDWPEEKQMAFRLADNKTSEYAEWDFDKLKDEFAELISMGFNLEATAFTEDEIKRIQADSMLDEEGSEKKDSSSVSLKEQKIVCPRCGYEMTEEDLEANDED